MERPYSQIVQETDERALSEPVNIDAQIRQLCMGAEWHHWHTIPCSGTHCGEVTAMVRVTVTITTPSIYSDQAPEYQLYLVTSQNADFDVDFTHCIVGIKSAVDLHGISHDIIHYIHDTHNGSAGISSCNDISHCDNDARKMIFGEGTNLNVSPRTDRKIPSVYRLKADNDKPEDGLPDTVCLVTDFPTPDKTLTVDGKDIQLNETSVLDKSTSDVWRYSTVIWDINNPSKDQSCNVTYDGKDVPQEKKIIDETATTCSSLTVNERFSTNPSMNTLSLSVLGLRMLTAKAVIFKLLITLRLWSS
ncbi:T cell receptor alpha chain MC.7.G5-like [Phyllobates terribilis]|uniref:T cell receptor alpha chain MC.7.G5-like n=1 Tax=Phyllobates terribilis TaxID=111132 RepID=UPI003CCB1456